MPDNIAYLRIESYSEHPEVGRAAEQLVESYMVSRARRREQEKYLRDARKLIASLWLKGEEDLFRFTTKAAYYSPAGRKQVWMTLHRDCLDLALGLRITQTRQSLRETG